MENHDNNSNLLGNVFLQFIPEELHNMSINDMVKYKNASYSKKNGVTEVKLWVDNSMIKIKIKENKKEKIDTDKNI